MDIAEAVYKDENRIQLLDAKYYSGGNLPDNEDVTKQFAYMGKAYQYYKDKATYEYRNIFILPTGAETYLSDTQVIFDTEVEAAGEYVPLELLYVNFPTVLSAYVEGKRIDLSVY